MRENRTEQPPQAEQEGQIKVQECVDVLVRSNEFLENVLDRFPGFVAYDKNKHDLTGVERQTAPNPPAMPDYAFTIVRE